MSRRLQRHPSSARETLVPTTDPRHPCYSSANSASTASARSVRRVPGCNGPDWLQYLLISQSDGKPGLAVALAERCKTEDVARIWSGEAAARELLDDLRLVKDDKEQCVLAAFAVGGETGMSVRIVSKALDLSLLELRQITANLGSGGLVEEVADDRLPVRPPAIRPVLVRDVFYSQSIDPLSWQRFGVVSRWKTHSVASAPRFCSTPFYAAAANQPLSNGESFRRERRHRNLNVRPPHPY